MRIDTLKQFEHKVVEVFTNDGRSRRGQIEGVIEQYHEMILSGLTCYERQHFGSIIIMTETIVAIRELIPEEEATCQDNIETS